MVEAQRFSRRPSTHAGHPLRSGGTTIAVAGCESKRFCYERLAGRVGKKMADKLESVLVLRIDIREIDFERKSHPRWDTTLE